MPRGGFGDLEKQLKSLAKNIERQASGEVSVNDLLNDSFMRQYTKFITFDEFLAALPDGSFEEMLEHQREMVDTFVIDNTNFKTWDDMIQKSGEIHVAKKLKKLF